MAWHVVARPFGVFAVLCKSNSSAGVIPPKDFLCPAWLVNAGLVSAVQGVATIIAVRNGRESFLSGAVFGGPL